MLLLLPPSTIFDSPDLSLVCEIGYKTTDIFWNGNGLSMHISFGNGFELTCDRKIGKMIEYVCDEKIFMLLFEFSSFARLKAGRFISKFSINFYPIFIRTTLPMHCE